jgi:hypothetical protein
MITLQPNAVGIRYKLVRLLIGMLLCQGLTGLAHLGCLQVQPNPFVMRVEIELKTSFPPPSSCSLIISGPNVLEMRYKVKLLIGMLFCQGLTGLAHLGC